jgi:FMN phosphatase YigB (HAD superfamily)
MIKVVMFDLGDTLIDEGRHPFPHVADALTAVADFKTAEGKALQSCLVSDYTMVVPPVTVTKVTALFNEYLAILEKTGLRSFFEPVNKRVTISTQAGVEKPNRKIFEMALDRLGAISALDECLFITEDSAHIKKARETLKMKTLQFRIDFNDWAEAPALIGNLVAPQQPTNTHAAIKAHLAARGIDLLKSEPGASRGAMKYFGQVWSPISVPGFKDLDDIHVAVPVEGKVSRGPKGEIRSVATKPSAEAVAEATSFARSLAMHGQIAGQKKGIEGATHQIETDNKGKRRLVRKRFTAV